MTDRVVDIGDIGFWEGRQFRISHEFSVPTGQSLIIRFTALNNFLLLRQEIIVDSGGIRFNALRDGVSGGSWSPIPIISKNVMSITPQYSAKTVIDQGGTVSGGTVVEVLRAVASGATAQAASVGATQGDQRGLPAGTYHLRLECLGNSTSTGVYTLIFEEMPLGTYVRI